MLLRQFAILLFSLVTLCAGVRAQTADLQASKSGPKTATADSDVTFVLGIDQIGPDSATNVSLTDPIPAGMTFVSLNQTSGPAMICTTPGVGLGGTISCTLAAMPSGSSIRFDAVVHIDAQTPPGTFFTNIVSVNGAEDPSNENDQAVATVFVPAPAADIGVGKSAPAHTAADSDLSYTLTLQNAGPDAATSVSLDDTLPGDLTFVSLTQNSGPALVCTTPMAGSGGTVQCTTASFAAGASATWTLVAHVPPGTPSGTSYSNTATVMSSEDPNPENNAATQLTSISSVDLAVTVDLPSQVTAGGPFASTIDWRNDGPDSAQQAQWTVVLPANTNLISIIQNNGPAANCSNLGSSVQCSLFNMPAAATASFTLNLGLAVSAPNGSSITVVASTSSENAEIDAADNQSSDSANVIGAADAVISKSAPTNTISDAPLAYTITVTNSGFADATSVHWIDTLPALTTFVALNQSGPTFSCTTPAVGAGGDVECDLATLAVGASTSFTLTVFVPSTVADGTQIDNSVALDSSSPDASTANNNASASTLVSGLADLVISKAAPLAVPLGGTIDYQILVANYGFQPALNVQWSDLLPSGLSFVSLTQTDGPAFTCTTPGVGAGGTVQCSSASLPAAAEAHFVLSVDTDDAAIGDVTNDVLASTTSADANAINNTGSYTIAIVAAPQQQPTGVPIPIVADWRARAALALLIVFALVATRSNRRTAASVR